MFSPSTNSIYRRFRSRRGSDRQANKQLLFELVRDDPRTLHAAYHPDPHTFEQYFIIASHKALLQAEQPLVTYVAVAKLLLIPIYPATTKQPRTTHKGEFKQVWQTTKMNRGESGS